MTISEWYVALVHKKSTSWVVVSWLHQLPPGKLKQKDRRKQTHSLFSTKRLTAQTVKGRGGTAERQILFMMVSPHGKRAQGMLRQILFVITVSLHGKRAQGMLGFFITTSEPLTTPTRSTTHRITTAFIWKIVKAQSSTVNNGTMFY